MSTYSIGSLNQLGDSLENAGWTAEDVTKLKQFKNLSGIKDVLNGKAEIKLIVPLSERDHNWREENGVIYFKVTSDGTTGEQWIARLANKGYRVGDYAKSLLRSPKFKPTSGVTTEIAVLKGSIFTDEKRITKNIRAEAAKRKLSTPSAEVACLIREMFTDEEIKAMGLSWIVTMHNPIKDSDGDSTLLGTGRNGGDGWLSTYCGSSGGRWDVGYGFAFAVSQVGLKS